MECCYSDFDKLIIKKLIAAVFFFLLFDQSFAVWFLVFVYLYVDMPPASFSYDVGFSGAT